MTSKQVLEYVNAEPFRPFRILMNSGRSYDIGHPEMVRVGRDFLIMFSCENDNSDLIYRWETVSLLLVKAVSHLQAAVA